MVLNENRASGALLGLCAASGLTMFGLAFAKSRQRWREILPADAMFIEDAAHFRGLSDVMRNYVERMDELSWLGAHYPPGNMLLLASLGLAGKYMVLIAAAASPALLWGAARRMGSSRHAAWWAAALMAAAPFVLMHASISMTTLVVPLSALSLWLGAICVCAPPNTVPQIRLIVSAGALGALLVIWSFFTFGVAFHALMLLVLLVLCLLQHHTPWHRAAASVLVAAAVTTVLLALLKLTSGYDTVAALREARANHFEQIGGLKLPPHDPLERTLLRSVGNILAFWTAHLPITAAALLTLGLSKRDRGVLRLIMPAAGITLLVAGFCGTFTLETERIWLFLVPPLALAAGQWLGDRALEDDYETPIWVVVMSICLALVIASTFQPYAG